MRAYVIRESFGLDHLVAVDRPDPQPGPGQVLVRMRAASLNYRDLLMVRGHYDPRQPLPLIPLSDGVGEVVATGEGVGRVAPGDRVAAIFAQRWLSGTPSQAALRSTLGGPLDGMLAEQVVLSEEGVVKVPAHLSDEEAATLPCAAVTAWSALVTQGGVTAGDTVVVQGSGGVSVFALQFARMLGARVFATTSGEAKAERLRALGAAAVVDYRQDTAWGKTFRALTDGRGVDLVVEVGGAGTMAQSLRCVRPGGTVSVIGVLSGTAAKLNLLPILMTGMRLQGVLVGHRDSFETMNRAIALHEMRPVVDRVFPFEETPAALEHLASGAHFGKVCVRF